MAARSSRLRRVGHMIGERSWSAMRSTAGRHFAGTRVGSSSGGQGNIDNSFEDNSGNAFADMDALNPGAKRHMWMYFTTPDVTSTSNDQNIRFFLTVKGGS